MKKNSKKNAKAVKEKGNTNGVKETVDNISQQEEGKENMSSLKKSQPKFNRNSDS